MKRKETRSQNIIDAAATSALLGLPKQAPKTLSMKRSMLNAVFNFAVAAHDGVGGPVSNPFSSKDIWRRATKGAKKSAAANEWKAFSTDELKALMKTTFAVPRPGSNARASKHLYWLTWLGLCTGARLNELCQLRAKNIRLQLQGKTIPNIF